MVLSTVMDVLKPKNVGSPLGDMIDFGALMAQLSWEDGRIWQWEG